MLKKFSLFAIVTLLLVACSSEEEKKPRNFDESLSAFMNNEDIAIFGHVGVQGILSKADYKSNPMLEAFVAGEVEKVNAELDINTPIYFALQGPMKPDGSPEKVFILFKVQNKEELLKDLKENRGYVMEKEGEIDYTEDGDFVLGIKNDMAIAVIQGGEYVAKDVVKEVFQMTEGEFVSGKRKELLAANGDIVVNINLEELSAASNDHMQDMEGMSKKEMEDLMKDSYMQMNIRFETGKAVIESKNYFSDKMKKEVAFKALPEPLFSTKIMNTDGEVVAAGSINADLSKFGHLIAGKDAEDALKQFQSATAMLTMMDTGLEVSGLNDGEGVRMPGSGTKVGGKGIQAFVNFDNIPEELITPDIALVAENLEYISLEGDDEGTTIIIKTKRDDENFLKTVVDIASRSLMGIMGGMSMM